jgi:hypothetical protein
VCFFQRCTHVLCVVMRTLTITTYRPYSCNTITTACYNLSAVILCVVNKLQIKQRHVVSSVRLIAGCQNCCFYDYYTQVLSKSLTAVMPPMPMRTTSCALLESRLLIAPLISCNNCTPSGTLPGCVFDSNIVPICI